MALAAIPHPSAQASDVALRITSADLNFTDCDSSYLTHSVHPYPAKFIPQIPRFLIEELSRPGDTVADVFCGSGTSLVEALLLERNAIGVDANPLACLISRAKTARMGASDAEPLLELVQRAREFADELSKGRTLWRQAEFVSSAPRPEDPALEFWFDKFVIEELAEILSWCEGLQHDQPRYVALTAFSSIVVSVSRQDSDTRYVRREKKVCPGDTASRFARALLFTTKAIIEFTRRVQPTVTCDVFHADVLDAPAVDHFDLMVCSPPYPNAYSYHLYHRTRMVWLGMDQPRFKQKEIGSHRKYSSKAKGAATASTFRAEMGRVLKWLARHLKPNGFACFVIGDSTIRGEKINNADLISRVANENGFVEFARVSRSLQPTKKAFNPAIGKIKQEQILVLENRLTS